MQLAGISIETLADHDAGLGDAVIVTRCAGQAMQSRPDIEVTGDGPERHVTLIARRPDVGTAGDDIDLVRVAAVAVPRPGRSPHIEWREAFHTAHRRAVAHDGCGCAIRDAKSIDGERRRDRAIQKQSEGLSVGTDFHPGHIHHTAVDRVAEEVTAVVGINEFIETYPNAEAIDAADGRQVGRRDVIRHRQQGRVARARNARHRHEDPIHRAVVRQGGAERERRLVGANDVGVIHAVELLPLVANKRSQVRWHGRGDHGQGHGVVLTHGERGRGRLDDEQLVEVRIAGRSEECSRHHIRGHCSGRQRHRGLQRARINGAHDHHHMVAAAAFLEQRFHVVGGAVGQREDG